MQKALYSELTPWLILLLLLSATGSGQNAVNAEALVESTVTHQRYYSVGSRSAILLIAFDARIHGVRRVGRQDKAFCKNARSQAIRIEIKKMTGLSPCS